MIKKMWRYLRQIDKYELLQQVISVHEVELLRKNDDRFIIRVLSRICVFENTEDILSAFYSV